MPLQRSAHIGALTEFVLCAAGRRRRRGDRSRLPDALHAFVAGSLRPRRSRGADAAAGRRHRGASTPKFSLDRDDFIAMKLLSRHRHRHLRIEGRAGRRRRARSSPAPRSRTRCSCRSRAGPSIGRARTGGATSPSSARSCSPKAASPPSAIRAVGCSAIGPCMLPVDADGEPLMNAVLYGVDARAAKEIEELTRSDRRGRAPRPLRQCADLAVGRPENPVAEAEPSGDLRQGRARSSPRPPISCSG